MSELAVETKGLGLRFGTKWAVRNLDLKVPRGSVFGLLGENGAGKSTTIQALMGILLPTEGESRVLGFNPVKDEVAVKSRVGYLPESYGFYEYMKVKELVAFVAAYHADWNRNLEQDLLREFKLDAATKVSDLSKGMRAKLALLLALAYEPELLILDEPAEGLDPAARRNFIEAILKRYQEEGKTILLSSHLLNEFSGLIDQVAFINEGQLEFSASVEELQKSMKRVRLIFDDGIPAEFQLDGALDLKLNGREAVATLTDFEATQSIARLQSLSATHIVIEDLTLEDIFVARSSA